MSEEVYSKKVVDEFVSGIFEVLGHTVGIVMEQRIQDGLNDRKTGAQLFDDLASVTKNAAARGFYEAMSERTLNPVDGDAMGRFTVIDGGRND